MKEKVYKVVVSKSEPGVFGVRAKTRQQAIAHVAGKLITADPATFEDGADFQKNGIAIESAVDPDQSSLV